MSSSAAAAATSSAQVDTTPEWVVSVMKRWVASTSLQVQESVNLLIEKELLSKTDKGDYVISREAYKCEFPEKWDRADLMIRQLKAEKVRHISMQTLDHPIVARFVESYPKLVDFNLRWGTPIAVYDDDTFTPELLQLITDACMVVVINRTSGRFHILYQGGFMSHMESHPLNWNGSILGDVERWFQACKAAHSISYVENYNASHPEEPIPTDVEGEVFKKGIDTIVKLAQVPNTKLAPMLAGRSGVRMERDAPKEWDCISSVVMRLLQQNLWESKEVVANYFKDLVAAFGGEDLFDGFHELNENDTGKWTFAVKVTLSNYLTTMANPTWNTGKDLSGKIDNHLLFPNRFPLDTIGFDERFPGDTLEKQEAYVKGLLDFVSNWLCEARIKIALGPVGNAAVFVNGHYRALLMAVNCKKLGSFH